MTGTSRVIWEVAAFAGQDPMEQVDSDELDPPTFEDIAGRGVRTVVVAPAATDVEIEIPASCAVLLVASSAVILRLATGETPLRVRQFLVSADTSEGEGVPARTLLLTGNGTDTAIVHLHYLETV